MLLDILIIAIVLAIVVTRFTKFKLPKDPRDKAARKADLERLRQRPLLRDDEPASTSREPVDITPVAEARFIQPKAKTKVTARDVKDLPGIDQIKALEPSFTEAGFLEGASSAYLYFVGAWNNKDEQGIENLTAPALTARLLGELEAKSYKPIPETTLTGASIHAARVHGKTAVVEVQFEGEENTSAGTLPFRRRWTLARPLNSEDPNWDVQDMQDLPTH